MADQVHPDISDTWNLRGAIYAEQHDFQKAIEAFQKANKLNPGDFWPMYNIAELFLMEKKYPEAVATFQKLAIYRGQEELVQFKLVLANLLQGKNGDAKQVLDGMKFPSDTAAYYFANAAWSYANKDEKKGKYWTSAGLKVFGLGRCVSFYDSLVQAGWLPRRNADGTVPNLDHALALPAEALRRSAASGV